MVLLEAAIKSEIPEIKIKIDCNNAILIFFEAQVLIFAMINA